MQKPFWQKWVAAVLVVLCLTTFFACEHEAPSQGLVIVEDDGEVEALTSQEIDQLDVAMYEVMERVIAATSLATKDMEDQLQKFSQYLTQEIALLKPTQLEYTALMSVLRRYLETEDFSAGTLVDNLYIDLTSALGKDNCAILVHRVLLRYCDYQAQRYRQRYDQFGYDFLLDDAERYREKYRVLSSRLSPSDLASVLNTYYLVETVRSFAGQIETKSFLSTNELLKLMKAQTCTTIKLDVEVWNELMTLAQDFVADTYFGKVLGTAIGNGDIGLLAEEMNDLIALIRHIQLTISTQDIQDIQQGKTVAGVILSLIEDDQLRQIDAFLSKGWHYAAYNDLAQKQYGDDYQRFVQQTETLTIDQLLETRRDASDAVALLVGYLAGKSYALAWEVQP